MTRASFLGIAVAAACLLTGCGALSATSGQPLSEPDKPRYSTAAELTTAASLVVRGTIGSLRETEVDEGGLTGSDGVPMRFFNVSVSSVLAGSFSGSSLVLGWVDNSSGAYSDISALTTGSDVVLFLAYRSDADTPGIQSVGAHYVALSDDNGVLDVVGDNVVARSPVLTSLAGTPTRQGATSQSGSDELFTASLADLAAVVAKHWG